MAGAKEHLLLARDQHKDQLKQDQAQLQTDLKLLQVSMPCSHRGSLTASSVFICGLVSVPVSVARACCAFETAVILLRVYLRQTSPRLHPLPNGLYFHLQTEVASFIELGRFSAVEERLATVQELESRIEALQQSVDLYQSREDIFGLPRTEYPLLGEVSHMLEPYASLWRCCAEFTRALPEWMDGPFPEINAENMATDVDRCGHLYLNELCNFFLLLH